MTLPAFRQVWKTAHQVWGLDVAEGQLVMGNVLICPSWESGNVFLAKDKLNMGSSVRQRLLGN